MIEIRINDKQVLQALANLEQHVSDLSPALKQIGEDLTKSTKQRFADRKGPDGKPWKQNSPVTIQRKGRDFPLTGKTGVLGDTINYQLTGNDTLEVGSPERYAAMQQFGGKKSEFPWLLGDIPARPFLGISNDDNEKIIEIIYNHLSQSF